MNQAVTPPNSTIRQVSDSVHEALAITLDKVQELIPQEDWVKKLQKSEKSGIPLFCSFLTQSSCGISSSTPRRVIAKASCTRSLIAAMLELEDVTA